MLLRTSLVDRVNGELADLLAGRSGSEQMLLELEDANAFVVSLDLSAPGFATTSCWRISCVSSSAERSPMRSLACTAGPPQWFADHGEVVEAVRHTHAAGDWHDAARIVADHSFRWVLDGQAGTISAVLRSFPQGASADHPDLALAHAATELNQGRLEEAAAQLALAESHVESAAARSPPSSRGGDRVLAVGARAAQRSVHRSDRAREPARCFDRRRIERTDRDGQRAAGSRADESRDRRDVVWAARRRRAAPLRGSRARPDDRPALPGGRVPRASRVPVEARLVRGRARARPSGRSPGRASWLGGSADPRARARGACRDGDLDGRVRRGRALAAPRLGGRRGALRAGRRSASARGDGDVARRPRAAPTGARGVRGGRASCSRC